jgi:hypothetical protein
MTSAALSQIDKAPVRLQPLGQYIEHRQDIARHQPAPHIAVKSSDKRNEMSSVSNRINLPSSTVPSITDDDLAERVSFALQAWGKRNPAPIKQIEYIADVDQKTASAWWHGKNPPRPGHLFTLALKIPELKAEIARLLRLEQDHDQSFQREAIALLQRYAR